MTRINLVFCHGRSDRCLSIRGYEFPICSRCTAIYAGFITGLLFEIVFGLPSKEILPVYILLVAPTGIDGLTQLLSDRESTNLIRLITGYPAGIGLILFVRTVSSIGI